MSEELIQVKDDLDITAMVEVAHKWFAVATDLKDIQTELVADLETALNLVRRYQEILVELNAPDPGLVAARLLLTKYKMSYTPPGNTARVYADGTDITEHPDSVPGSVAENELPEPDRIELIQTEDGKMHFRPVYDELTIEAKELPQTKDEEAEGE